MGSAASAAPPGNGPSEAARQRGNAWTRKSAARPAAVVSHDVADRGENRHRDGGPALRRLQTVEQIAGLQADALFMSTSAVSATDAFHQEERIVAVKRAMVGAATRRYLLVDHSKLGCIALHKIVHWTYST
jgi:hypothetical protein